ncbi:alpha/beta hydrolase fold domain-containing protein [Hirsutella rhossiliensis]|uniref:Alpha/beta hydrolase fold domain-containing protein n=1 Tax=Hirsutella rhossiliensis TaxID=111463 RepID=A0A9P8SMY2_9HYPO|nr:alpha/beta hydrolase fold domain-containing protein [Hirsutella rhossiliensis]KAH0968491.1 alpha/beta hydrolase fold domain-containing protein [Hirsutella rhossiliensis]
MDVTCAPPSAAGFPPTSTRHRRPRQQNHRLGRHLNLNIDAALLPRRRSRSNSSSSSPSTSSCSSAYGTDHRRAAAHRLEQQQQQQQQPHHHHHHQPHHHHHQPSSSSSPSPSPSAAPPAAPSAACTPPSSATHHHPSPEVISNLITSLAAVSPPSAGGYFDSRHSSASLILPDPAACPSPLPSSGSFGVDYGAYNRPSLDHPAREPLSLDDLAACPPVIRTAKPPSGFSPLTAAPARHSSHDSVSGLRSFIRSSSTTASRPSSRGSAVSKNDDAHSIGNLSIERASALTPDLKPRRSLDSWGRKAARGAKGLKYMTSRERLRERDLDRKRASAGSSPVPGQVPGIVLSPGDGPTEAPRPDPLFAETAIRGELSVSAADQRGMASPNPIPSRDSSLRTPTSRRKRLGPRHSTRDGEHPWGDAILEDDEHSRARAHDPFESEMTAMADKSFLLGLEDEFPTPPRTTPAASRQARPRTRPKEHAVERDDESAPYPSVSSGRRRAEHSTERSGSRVSGRQSPAPRDALKLKRSSSKLKRLSAGPLSPRSDERPGSADSVDDAVESYLCSPRLSQKIRHPQTGRVISFSEVGDANGSAVFCCVGMGLTRYITAFYDELALTLKLRLITPDRPGVGDSDPYSDGTATPLSWPDDVYAICQALKITKFSILAHSAGAIYALATALRMPQHIRGRIHLLAPWIPPSQMNVFGSTQAMPPTNAIPTSQKILRALPTPILKAANSSFMTATSSSITSSLPKNPRRTKRKATLSKDLNAAPGRNATPMLDADSLGQGAYGRDDEGVPGPPTATENMDRMQPPQGAIGATFAPVADRERQMTYDTRLTHAIWELATTGANPAVDLLVCLERRHTIGFRYVDITRPVVIHHGSRDTRVPVDNVKWLGKTMRRCEVRVLEGEGHGLMASAGVMGSVLMEMSKEWEDWMRATGADGRKDRDRARRATLVAR